jgi:hypothetical protein
MKARAVVPSVRACAAERASSRSRVAMNASASRPSLVAAFSSPAAFACLASVQPAAAAASIRDALDSIVPAFAVERKSSRRLAAVRHGSPSSRMVVDG